MTLSFVLYAHGIWWKGTSKVISQVILNLITWNSRRSESAKEHICCFCVVSLTTLETSMHFSNEQTQLKVEVWRNNNYKCHMHICLAALPQKMILQRGKQGRQSSGLKVWDKFQKSYNLKSIKNRQWSILKNPNY